MSLVKGGSIAGIVILFVVLVASPLIIYHLLIFPNVEGVYNDLSFYQADEMSSHHLYWFFFWGVGAVGTSFAIGFIKRG